VDSYRRELRLPAPSPSSEFLARAVRDGVNR
jgi:hypothetical protein